MNLLRCLATYPLSLVTNLSHLVVRVVGIDGTFVKSRI